MQIIGFMGKSGSGKTTITNYLEGKPNVGVIHYDKYVDDLLDRIFGVPLKSEKADKEESKRAMSKLIKLKSFFYKNKLMFKMFIGVRNKLIEKDVDKQIEQFKKDGKTIIILDDWVLSMNKKMYSKCNKIYVMNRKYLSRRNGLRERDNITSEEAKSYDIPYALGYVTVPKGKKVRTIGNNGSIESLYAVAQQEYESWGDIPFDERYALRGKTPVFTPAMANLRNVSTRREQSQTQK